MSVTRISASEFSFAKLFFVGTKKSGNHIAVERRKLK